MTYPDPSGPRSARPRYKIMQALVYHVVENQLTALRASPPDLVAVDLVESAIALLEFRHSLTVQND